MVRNGDSLLDDRTAVRRVKPSEIERILGLIVLCCVSVDESVQSPRPVLISGVQTVNF